MDKGESYHGALGDGTVRLQVTPRLGSSRPGHHEQHEALSPGQGHSRGVQLSSLSTLMTPPSGGPAVAAGRGDPALSALRQELMLTKSKLALYEGDNASTMDPGSILSPPSTRGGTPEQPHMFFLQQQQQHALQEQLQVALVRLEQQEKATQASITIQVQYLPQTLHHRGGVEGEGWRGWG